MWDCRKRPRPLHLSLSTKSKSEAKVSLWHSIKAVFSTGTASEGEARGEAMALLLSTDKAITVRQNFIMKDEDRAKFEGLRATWSSRRFNKGCTAVIAT